MAVPTLITDLSSAAASNSPAGSESIGTSLDDYIRAAFAFIHQLFDTQPLTAASTSGTTTYTATASPAPTAYTTGQVFAVTITNTNTGAVTFNFNSLGAKTVKKSIGGAAVALVANDLIAATPAIMRYDGTDLILLNPVPHAHGADVASASTVVLNSVTGDFVDITGTTTITAITLAEGRIVKVRAAGAFTLQNGASLINPTSADIVAAAGDTFEVWGYASGVVRIMNYQRLAGTPVGGATYKVGTTTYNIATASGSQAITGIGFKPKAVIMWTAVDNTAQMSVGASDASTNRAIYDRNGVSAGTYASAAAVMLMEVSGGNNVVTTISSMDADGFTLSHTKTGSPTGTATINYIALR